MNVVIGKIQKTNPSKCKWVKIIVSSLFRKFTYVRMTRIILLFYSGPGPIPSQGANGLLSQNPMSQVPLQQPIMSVPDGHPMTSQPSMYQVQPQQQLL